LSAEERVALQVQTIRTCRSLSSFPKRKVRDSHADSAGR
jgi:hypothetical protein